MKKILLVASVLVALVGPARADEGKAISGNKLLTWCYGGLAYQNEGMCYGFVLAIFENMLALAVRDGMVSAVKMGIMLDASDASTTIVADLMKNSPWCITIEGATSQQAVEVVKKYLSNNPEQLHRNARELIRDAFHAAWPCR